MDKSRRLVLLTASAAVVMVGCGGGDDDTAPVPAPAPTPAVGGVTTLSCSQSVISNNHGHALVSIPSEDLDSTINKVYNIQGQSTHSHTITLTPTQLAQIKAGTAVTVNSTEDSSHTHSVTVNCA